MEKGANDRVGQTRGNTDEPMGLRRESQPDIHDFSMTYWIALHFKANNPR
jgi:hypothetical protein